MQKENRQIYPACLPRVKEGYKDGTFFVAGWGLLKSRIVEVKIQTYIFIVVKLIRILSHL